MTGLAMVGAVLALWLGLTAVCAVIVGARAAREAEAAERISSAGLSTCQRPETRGEQ